MVTAGATVTWALGSFLSIAVGGTLNVFGANVWRSGSAATFQDGSELDQNVGALWLLHGSTTVSGSLSFTSTALVTFQNGSDVEVAPTSNWVISGAMTWQAGKWPNVTTRTTERHSIDIECTTGNLPTDPDAWKDYSSISAGAGAIVTKSKTTAGSQLVIRFTNMPIGATITSASIITKGLTGAAPTLPVYRIVRWTGSSSREYLSSSVTDTHTLFDWLTDYITTNASATTGDLVVSPAYGYGILVFLPYQSSGGASMEIVDAVLHFTSTSLQT
jgi:hypothetical protein